VTTSTMTDHDNAPFAGGYLLTHLSFEPTCLGCRQFDLLSAIRQSMDCRSLRLQFETYPLIHRLAPAIT
jgi:hypothetical protein